MKPSICVFGDVMLDTYVRCNPDRVSSEAPVIIAKEVERTFAPGGAANVAVSCSLGFGTPTALVGIVGKDSEGDILETCLINHSVSVDYLVNDPGWQTIEKARFVDSLRRQMLRVDRDGHSVVPPSTERALRDRLTQLAVECDCLVISDYDKGTCTPALIAFAIEQFRHYGKYIVVNGKPNHFMWYAGASVLTLNLKEAAEANRLFGSDTWNGTDIVSLAGMLHNILWREMRHNPEPKTEVLITMGNDGMVWWKGNDFRVVKAVPVEVADVTGAGDTVTATIACHKHCDQHVLETAARNAAKVVSQHSSALLEARKETALLA